ncbi:hypothetical protein KM043_012917 [Ampulex compressa]|nr:hypothetical protein KM043_012917 [Ampulex compressa]
METKLANVVLLLMLLTPSSVLAKRHNPKFQTIRTRVMLRRSGVDREELKPQMCYDHVGCFSDPPPHLSLKRRPESPSVIQTKFMLYTRNNRQTPEMLVYSDDSYSLRKSHFNATRALKVVIHGFKGSGSDPGVFQIVKSFLDLEDANVLILDWTRGAGTTYSAAVANTELVGRQLALVLLDSISLGTPMKNIHIVGFSLGAHVAGCASEMLKSRNLLLGRITGLDPASPFFRRHLFREKSRKLDASDAQLVDVIHTDGAPDFTDGFGLLKPIGHIDFFPNGGIEQPGCTDVKNAVVVSRLKEDTLDVNIACSHLRAWQLFAESLKQQGQCKFVAWPCSQGGFAYTRGACFPMETTAWSQEMGYEANNGPLGTYYLATRENEPFCGQPVRASVTTSDDAPKTFGNLYLKIFHQNSTTFFRIPCSLPKRRNEKTIFHNIAAVEFGWLTRNVLTINAVVWYKGKDEDTEENTTRSLESEALLLNKLAIEDRKGTRQF